MDGFDRIPFVPQTKCMIFVTAFVTTLLITQPANAWQKSLPDAVLKWANLIAEEITKSSAHMRLKTAEESYKNVKMNYVNGSTLLHEKASQIRDLLYRRREAVVNIRKTAESLSDVRLPPGQEYPQPYDSVKKIVLSDKEEAEVPTYAPPVELPDVYNWTERQSAHFPGYVNLSYSGVHLPSDVYDGSLPPNLTGELFRISCYFWFFSASQSGPTYMCLFTEPIIQHGIWVSKFIEPVFLENYRQDNLTSYQYFAHIKGFMRMFPAVRMGDDSDYYDARFRPWFSSAATSNKNIVILLDNSGSMKGKNLLIARHVINNILDTLNPDDFVNIVLFGQNSTNPTIKCLENKLIPATFLNVVELKRSLIGLKPSCPSSLEVGLRYAFNLLDKTRENRTGAMCNQAIMVVTDGPWMDTSIFGKHNEPFGTANKPVRVFTYQVGEFLRDAPGLQWIACQNQGWYLNVTTESAVRDRVATYIPVMARPWLMQREHLIHWTHAYFHRKDTISLDTDWIKHERDTQKKRLLTYRKYRKTPEELPLGNEDKPRFLQENIARKKYDKKDTDHAYLVITVSTPVYNLSVNVSSPFGELLGVAGIDIPVEDIQRIVPPYKAGVNNYFFMVNNNGFVIFHPDLRLTFFDTIKPTYASVDMAELEVDLSTSPGHPGGVELLREQIVNQRNGTLVYVMEQPFDDMTRVETVRRRYYFTPIRETPYSLVLAVNEFNGTWSHTFRAGRLNGSRLAQYFEGKWRTHPMWYYCRCTENAIPVPDSHLLRAIEDWYWEGKVLCDKELIDSLVEDASLTAWFPRQDQKTVNNRRKLEPFVTFIATKSGLTRHIDMDELPERNFSALHPRGPEEVWYRRAAMHHNLIMVTSGPVLPTFTDDVNLEDDWQSIHPDDMIITVSKAVVVENHKPHRNIPAVVGMQFKQNTLQAAFDNITGSQKCVQKPCVPACGSPNLECYLLDSDSIIIASSQENATGLPFGKVHPQVMKGLIDDGIFRVVRMWDNQAICLRPVSSSRPLFTPKEAWMSTTIVLTAISIAKHFLPSSSSSRLLSIAAASSFCALTFATPTSDSIDSAYDYGYEQPGKIDLRKFLNKLRIPKSRPQSCTRQIDAMQLRLIEQKQNSKEQKFRAGRSASRHHPEVNCPDRPYSAAYVSGTNLLFVAVLADCNSSKTVPDDIRLDLSRIEVNYSASCFLTSDLDLTRHRTRAQSCKSHHRNEELNKTECGLDHMVPVDEAPPLPPMFMFQYNHPCSKKNSAKKKDKASVEF